MDAEREAQGPGDRKWLNDQPREADANGPLKRGRLFVIHVAKRRNNGRCSAPENLDYERWTAIGLVDRRVLLRERT